MKRTRFTFSRAFTLIEMMVAVSILVLIILSVGVIFAAVSRSVGMSQSTISMLSNISAIEDQFQRDASGIDKNGFLVIRSVEFTDNSTTPPTVRRGDQVCFLAYGSFPNRTGANTTTSMLTDRSVAPSALVWWGQLAIEASGFTSPADPTNPRDYLKPDETAKVPLNQVPTGQTDSDFILGRSAMLLTSQNIDAPRDSAYVGVGSLPAFQSTLTGSPLAAIDYNAAPITFGNDSKVDITESRVDVAAVLPSQIMSILTQTIGSRTANPNFEATHYCFRRAALRSPYDSELPTASLPVINGVFRMSPIALQGVSSFTVEWTDGTKYGDSMGPDIDSISNTAVAATSPLFGTTRWYGLHNAKSGVNNDGVVDPYGQIATTSNGDKYDAIFSFDNRNQWPKALRLRYHITDPSGRIPGGRDIVQIVTLP